jgi:hypothetical protein
MQTDINIQTKKIDLIQWLSTIENEEILDKVSELISSEMKNDWWLHANNEEKESITKGLKDAAEKKLNPHSKAKAIYGKWL